MRTGIASVLKVALGLTLVAGCSNTGLLWPDVEEGQDVVDGGGRQEEESTVQPELFAETAPECQDNEGCANWFADLGVCETAACDTVLGVCVRGKLKDGTVCDDGDLCNGEGACLEGVCQAGEAIVCQDDNPCTDDGCDPAVGCTFTNNSAGCDDTDPCTDQDFCQDGSCVGTASACDDGDPCTEDSCDEEGNCTYEPLWDVPCDDGDECTGEDLCQEGLCIGGANVCFECDDGTCEEGENCVTCPADCGACLNGCCEVAETAGCSDQAVVECTCQIDEYCCEVAWDDLCIQEATAECGLICVVDPCGDGQCVAPEDCDTCPDDCGKCPGCGDGQCVAPEDCATCPADCGKCPGCGDGSCQAPEDCYNCPEDCGQCATCGDGVCSPLESCKLCPADCGLCAICGDSTCDPTEDCKACPVDCGPCCGDGACSPVWGEDCSNCPADCGQCTACGNGVCNSSENCITCTKDCGQCQGSCCLAKNTIGCANPAVQACVCAADPFCCTTKWDIVCAGEADECGSCNGDCCATHNNPGCDSEDIEACVCAVDPFCCEVAWDGLCVKEVTDLKCGSCTGVPVCGDKKCDGSESCKSCPQDCGLCCGNGSCEALLGEDCTSCAADCGACPVNCGDGKCQSGETCVNCVGDCGLCTGSCCLANGTPGCIDANVQGCVCAIDPYCCNTQWDSICAEEADDCGSCNGDCCALHSGPGCADEAIEKCVCAADPFCCEVMWDNLCVNEVEDLECGKCGADVCGNGICGPEEDCFTCSGDCGKCCGNGSCEGAFGEDCKSCEADCGACPVACGNKKCDADESCVNCPGDCGACTGSCCLTKGTPGCQDKAVQDCVCAVDFFCCSSNWDDLCASEADQCGSCAGDCCAANGSAGCDDEAVEACVCAADPYCCDVTWDQICANEVEQLACGQCQVVPECGNGICGLGENCANCEIDCGKCPVNCGNQVCDADESCVTCPQDCGDCTGSCCLANGTPGCANAAVQGCVCAVDPYCCSVQWDNLCAAEADDCGSCSGDCCAANGTPGCDLEEVEECVCAGDPYCCDINWDNLCVQEVTSLSCGQCGGGPVCGDGKCEGTEDCKSCAADCGVCPVACGNKKCDADESCIKCPQDCGQCTGSCCIANDTPGCQDAAVQKCVCASDAFCCDHVWDALCAAEADDCGSCNGDCCAAHTTPGCADETIEACVCAEDAFCCSSAWDALCVSGVADNQCGQCGGGPVCGDGKCDGTESCESCPGDCGPCAKPGNCCEPTAVPGCNKPAVQACVCAQDSYCCNVAWDNLCVQEVESLNCGQCIGSCCAEHAEPGCDDQAVQDCVCAADAFCCDTSWDALCVSEVDSLGCGQCTVPGCGDGMCAANETCQSCPDDCGACPQPDCAALWTIKCDGSDSFTTANGSQKNAKYSCFDGDYSAPEYVYSFTPTCTGLMTATLTKAAGVSGYLDLFLLGGNQCNGDNCMAHALMGTTTAVLQFDVTQGTPYFMVVDGYEGAQGQYDLKVTCACGQKLCGNGQCEASENCSTCPADCGYCPGTEKCCVAHNSAGCELSGCQEAVCEMDSFCCEVKWDQTCANEAAQLCPSCGAAGTGDCCKAQATPGCQELSCQQKVCAEDTFCCNTQWDSICVNAATQLCPSCSGLADNCCVEHETPGCSDPAIQACVCAQDPFCCNTTWDALCVEGVADFECGKCL